MLGWVGLWISGEEGYLSLLFYEDLLVFEGSAMVLVSYSAFLHDNK
jgi:hypothetical protein